MYNEAAMVTKLIDNTMPETEYKTKLLLALTNSEYIGRNDWAELYEDMLKEIQEKQ